ncbi:unnamed protein product, partial [Prorocentrum cordatum]
VAGMMRAIGRIFASLSSSCALETECDLQVVNDAVSMGTQELIDHAVLELRMQTRTAKRTLANCLNGCHIQFEPIHEQWHIVNSMMALAAELTRYEMQAKVLVNDNDSSRQARLLTLKLINDATNCAAELGISAGAVYLKRPAVFHAHARGAQAQLLAGELGSAMAELDKHW